MNQKSVTTTKSQERANRISHPLDVSDGMPEPPKVGPVVSVFLAEPSRMSCELMAAALQRSRYKLTLAGYATDSVGIRAWFEENDVDVAIINTDLREGATAAFDVTREIRSSHPQTSVIMMIELIERVMIVEAFRAGARGIFSRDNSFDLLCKCIQVVHEGQIWADNKALRFLIDTFVRSKPPEAGSVKRANLLTKREEGVVQLVADGLTNRDISQQLNLSENTVRNYLFRIFNKLGTSNRLELALYSITQRKNESPRN
jgi:two-component system nitrate/nitrite response regulator NarL